MRYIKKFEYAEIPKFFEIGDKVIVGNSGYGGDLKKIIENNIGEIVGENLTTDYMSHNNTMTPYTDWDFNVKFYTTYKINDFDNKIWLKQTRLRKATEQEIYEYELKSSQNKYNL